MRHDAEWAREAQRELRSILNGWDPIGVFRDEDDDSTPPDEYDCIRDPLILRLLRGDSREEVAAFLADELEDHFGLARSLVTQADLDRILGWWETVR